MNCCFFKYTFFCFLLTLFFSSTYAQENKRDENDSTTKKVRPKIGLVLSGGGAKGLAHIGVIKVLEEAGIQPDFIGGTSMGAIIGGFYALGYSTEFIEHIVKSQDWNQLIYDRFPRNYINISEKGIDESFLINFPLRQNKFSMPSGVIQAQEITWLFSKLCTPSYRNRNFDDLQTPFLCIGTDLKTGKSILLNSGDLAMAMRSSMAIPVVFTPVKHQGSLLVDGGVVNNYPVLDVKNMGADIIIGSDVQFSEVSTDELQSMTGAMMHIIGYHSVDAQKKAEKETDIYIHPDIDSFGVLSFDKADTLIKLGEIKAREYLPQLKALADSLNKIEKIPIKIHQTVPLDSIYIENIEYLGLNRVPQKMLDGYKSFNTPNMIAISDIETWVRSIHGTKFFSLVRYEFIPISYNRSILRLTLQEASSRILSAGLHFDSDYKTDINLKATFRNWLFPASKANIILALGNNIKFRADYWINNGMRPGPGLALDFTILNTYQYKDQKRTSVIRCTDIQFTPFFKSIFKSYIELGIAAQLEYSGLHPSVSYISLENINKVSVNGMFYAKADTRNALHYPNKGTYFDFTVKAIQQLSNTRHHLYWFGCVSFNTSIKFSNLFTLRPLANAVLSSEGWEMPPHPEYNAFLGGCVSHTAIIGGINFIGLRNIQFTGNHAYSLGVDAQFNIWKNKHFIVGTFNFGDIKNELKAFANTNNMVFGMGVTYAYNSFVGPISVTAMGGNNLNFGAFLNIGFKL